MLINNPGQWKYWIEQESGKDHEFSEQILDKKGKGLKGMCVQCEKLWV
jgi:hypothetical protein